MTRCPVVCPLNQVVASLGSWHKNAITVDSWILLGSSQETIPDCGLNKGSSKSDKLRQAVSHCSFKIRVCPCKHVELIKDILKVYNWYLSSSCLPQLTILGYLMVSPLVWRNPSRWPISSLLTEPSNDSRQHPGRSQEMVGQLLANQVELADVTWMTWTAMESI